MSDASDTVRLRPDGITWREIDGELVILDLMASRYLTTNRSAAVLLRLLTEERTANELSGALVSSFAISQGQAQADVAAFLGALQEANLLAPAGSPVA